MRNIVCFGDVNVQFVDEFYLFLCFISEMETNYKLDLIPFNSQKLNFYNILLV